MVRWTVTDVAWFTLAQPTAPAVGAAAPDDAPPDDAAPDDAAPDDPAAADEAPVPLAAAEDAEDVAEAQPATAEHSSTASTVPRTWRGDIMLL
jgi:hypothetical protein